MDEPPSLPGAFQTTRAEPSLGVTEFTVGASGTVNARALTGALGDEGPAKFVATTLTE
jgi:hypothetical protein